jgi:DnaK suppressor protein
MTHLTDDQLEGFRRRLLAMSAQVEALLTQTEADTRPVDLELPIGRLTRIDAIQMQAMAQQNRRQVEARGQQVAAALNAFGAGTYGLCRHCKGPISLRRLEVLPETPFCLDCQESFEQERKYRPSTPPSLAGTGHQQERGASGFTRRK